MNPPALTEQDRELLAILNCVTANDMPTKHRKAVLGAATRLRALLASEAALRDQVVGLQGLDRQNESIISHLNDQLETLEAAVAARPPAGLDAGQLGKVREALRHALIAGEREWFNQPIDRPADLRVDLELKSVLTALTALAPYLTPPSAPADTDSLHDMTARESFFERHVRRLAQGYRENAKHEHNVSCGHSEWMNDVAGELEAVLSEAPDSALSSRKPNSSASAPNEDGVPGLLDRVNQLLACVHCEPQANPRWLVELCLDLKEHLTAPAKDAGDAQGQDPAFAKLELELGGRIVTLEAELAQLRSTAFHWTPCSGPGGRMPTEADSNRGMVFWMLTDGRAFGLLWDSVKTSNMVAWSRVPAYTPPPLVPAASETEREAFIRFINDPAIDRTLDGAALYQLWQNARKAKEERAS